MDEPFSTLWLLEDSVPNVVSGTLQLTYGQLLPYNPMRWALVVASHQTSIITYSWGDQAPTYAMGTIIMAAGQQSLVIQYSEIGELLRMPLWAKSSVAANNIVIAELSINPNRFSQMRRYMHEWASKFKSP